MGVGRLGEGWDRQKEGQRECNFQSVDHGQNYKSFNPRGHRDALCLWEKVLGIRAPVRLFQRETEANGQGIRILWKLLDQLTLRVRVTNVRCR